MKNASNQNSKIQAFSLAESLFIGIALGNILLCAIAFASGSNHQIPESDLAEAQQCMWTIDGGAQLNDAISEEVASMPGETEASEFETITFDLLTKTSMADDCELDAEFDWFRGVGAADPTSAFAEALAQELSSEEAATAESDEFATDLLYASVTDLRVTVSSWW